MHDDQVYWRIPHLLGSRHPDQLRMAKRRKTQQKQTSKSKPASQNPKVKGPQPTPKSGKAQTKKTEAQGTNPRDLEPTIPLSPEDAILLVGEGDLSFSRALVEHHYCENVTATVLEANLEELTDKYPQVQGNVDVIESEGSKVIYGVDAKKMGPWVKKPEKDSIGIYDRICTPPPPTIKQLDTFANEEFPKYSTFPTSAAKAPTSTGRFATTKSSSSSSSSEPCCRSLPAALWS